MSAFNEIIRQEIAVMQAHKIDEAVIKEVTHSLQIAHDAEMHDLLAASVAALTQAQIRLKELESQLEITK